MNIFSWNVAGLRARLKPDENHSNSLMRGVFSQKSDNGLGYKYFDIVCLQETKCKESEVKLPSEITDRYPYRFWNSNDGSSQRKGLSGTCIWCTKPPINWGVPDFDKEGRVIMVGFEDFILVNVYVPNSGKFEEDRYYFRSEWNNTFRQYITNLEKSKNVIICGDLNVAHLDIDISNPKQKKNKVAGFYDIERSAFNDLLVNTNLVDVFRIKNEKQNRSTYWSNFLKSERTNENGWGIDYFLASKQMYEKNDLTMKIMIDVKGSDHCPIVLTIT